MIVLDTSALLALAKGEPGEVVVIQAMTADLSFVSAVNWAEMLQKATQHGLQANAVAERFERLEVTVVNFTKELAAMTAGLYRHRSNLSIADRACLAVAKSFTATAYTADAAWLDYADDFGVHVIDIRATDR